jgi:hypothetical protein
VEFFILFYEKGFSTAEIHGIILWYSGRHIDTSRLIWIMLRKIQIGTARGARLPAEEKEEIHFGKACDPRRKQAGG